ncbi:MAG: MinD/ParA family protein [Bdellovibrionales bacterium]|nr:MinD/ParA family protein [Bdellovibrionales bacterium]
MTEKSIRTISITSGKGGVGKTTLTTNLSYLLSNLNKKVLILDGDMSLANVDIFFRKNPDKTLKNFFDGTATLPEIIVKYSKNVHILPGSSGILELTQLNAFQKKMLIDGVSQLEGEYDYLLIDTASGISDEVLYLSSAAQEVFVVLQADPSSLTDSYALIKLLHQKYKIKTFSIVANQVLNEQEALKVYDRINTVAAKFLNINLQYVGYVPFDIKLRQATAQQELVSSFAPHCSSSFGMKRIADFIDNSARKDECRGGLQFFWNQVLNIA